MSFRVAVIFENVPMGSVLGFLMSWAMNDVIVSAGISGGLAALFGVVWRNSRVRCCGRENSGEDVFPSTYVFSFFFFESRDFDCFKTEGWDSEGLVKCAKEHSQKVAINIFR